MTYSAITIFFSITIRLNLSLNSFSYSKAKGIQEKQDIQEDHVQPEEIQEEVVQPEEIQEEQVFYTVVVQLLYSSYIVANLMLV